MVRILVIALALASAQDAMAAEGQCMSDGKDVESQCGKLSPAECSAQVACAWAKGQACVGDIARYDEPCGKIGVEYDTYKCEQQIACKVAETAGSCKSRLSRVDGCAKQSAEACAGQLGCEFKVAQCLPTDARFAATCCGLTKFARFTPRTWGCNDAMGCVGRSEEFAAQCGNITDLDLCKEQVACSVQEVCKWKISEPTCVKMGTVRRCFLNAGCSPVKQCIKTVEEASFCPVDLPKIFA